MLQLSHLTLYLSYASGRRLVSEAAQQRLDFVARAANIAQRHPIPAIILVHATQAEAYTACNGKRLICLWYLKHHLDLADSNKSPESRKI